MKQLEYYCASCGKQISQRQFDEYDGLCRECYETEIQFMDEDAEDYEEY